MGKFSRIATLLTVLLLFAAAFAPPAFAEPQGGTVTGGSAVIDQAIPGTTTINQITDRVIIDWQRFGINVNELVRFIQPSDLAVALNRITGADPSVILGSLQANGRLFIVNPNGVLFGAGSRIDTAGLVATTLNISNEDFLNGNYRFVQDPNKTLSYVINKGNITAKDGGHVVLMAPFVANEGVIVANMGTIALGAATSATVNFDSRGLINFVVPEAGAPKGNVVVDEQAYDDILGSVVNAGSLVDAGAVTREGGKVVLKNAEGVLVNSGTIQANGAPGRDAGAVTLNSTQATAIGSTSVLEAKGLGESSNGGFIETSSMGNFAVRGKIDTSAENGATGTWLLDPSTITITAGAAAGDLDPTFNASIPPGQVVFVDADQPLNTISEAAIEAIAAGSNILLQAANTITINDLSIGSDGVLTLTNNTSIRMDTNNGNITFVNPANTILASGTGKITINAGQIALSGGQAIMGNLTANNTQINVTADGNVTLAGLVNAGIATGIATITSNNGRILDTNAGANTIAAHAINLTGIAGIGTFTNPTTYSPVRFQLNGGNLTLTTAAGAPTQIVVAETGGDFAMSQITGLTNFDNAASLILVGNSSGNITVNAPINIGTRTAFLGTNAAARGIIFNGGSFTTSTGSIYMGADGAGGTITQVGGADDIIITGAGIANVRAVGGIGTAADPLKANISGTGTLSLGDGAVSAGDIYADWTNGLMNTGQVSASTVAGAQTVRIRNTAGGITVGSAFNAGDDNLTLQTTLAPNGINFLDTFSVTSGGTVTLTSAGAISDAAASVNDKVFGSTVTLTAGAGDIGALGQPIETNTANLVLTATGAIYAANNVATPLANLTVTTNDAVVAVNFGAVDSLTYAGAAGNLAATAFAANTNVSFTNATAGFIVNGINAGLGNVTLSGAGLGVTQTGGILASGLALLGAGPYTLANVANDVSTLAANTAAVSYRDATGFSIGTVGATTGVNVGANTLTLQAGGAVTQAAGAAITATGLELLGVGPYTLTEATNNIVLLAGTTTGSVSYRDANTFDIGTVGVSTGLNVGANTLTLNAAGAVGQAAGAAITATGLELLGTGPYALTEATNEITNLAAATGGNVSYRDATGFSITTVGATTGMNVGANALTLQAGGAVTQTAGAAVAATGLELLGAGPYTLTEATNEITNIAGATAGSVSYRDATGFAIGTVGATTGLNVGANNLTLQAGGAVTQNGLAAVTATGLELLGTGPFTLTEATNEITNLAGLTTGNVAYRDATGFSITAVGGTTGLNVGANTLTLQAGGAVTQTALAAVTATGLELLGAGPYTLTDATNDITTLAAGTTSSLSYRDATGFSIGTAGVTTGVNVGANTVTLQNGGAVTQAAGAAITATGLELLGSGTYALTEATNEITNLAAGTTNNLSYRDATGFSIGTVGATTGMNVGANTLTLQAGGAVTQVALAAITATGLELLGTGPYTLTEATNEITTLAAATGGNVSYRDATGFSIGTVGASTGVNVGANTLSLTAGGAVTQVALAAVTATGLELLGTGSYTLTEATNDVTSLAALTTSSISYRDASGFGLGTVGATTGVNVGANTLTLNAAGAVGQGAGAAVTATGLELLGSGSYALTEATNEITTFAAGTTNNVSYRDATGFSIGTVGATTGLSVGANNATLQNGGAVTQAAGAAVSAAGLELLGSGTYSLTEATNNISTLAGSTTNTISYIDASGFDIGTVNTAGLTSTGNITISASGAVTDSAATTAAGLLLRGTGPYTLDAANAVGTLASDSTGVLIFNNAGALTVGSVGGINGITTGGVNATVTTTNGTMTLGQSVNAGAGTLTLTAGGAAGNLDLGGQNTTGATMNLTSGNVIQNYGGTFTYTTLNLTSGGDIGTGGVNFGTVGGTVSATSTGGSIFLNNTGTLALGTTQANTAGKDVTVTSSGALTLGGGGVSAGNNVNLTATTGNLSLGSVTAGSTATLTASAGNILSATGGTNVRAASGTLSAPTGYVGTKNSPVQVAITGGPLTVNANAMLDQVSININGTISPANTFTFVPANPPGLVLFNGLILYPQGLIDGNPLLANTAGTFTETMLKTSNEDQLNPKSKLYETTNLVEEEEEEAPAPKPSTGAAPSTGGTAAPQASAEPGYVVVNVVAQGGDPLKGAEIYVDGKKIEKGINGNYKIPAGSHRLTVKKQGYGDYSADITVGSGSHGSLNVVLTPRKR